jgi:hypothetical protein
MLVLASVGSETLLKNEKQGAEKMREVGSCRKRGWHISLLSATIKLLKRDKSLYHCLHPFIKLKLCNTLQNMFRLQAVCRKFIPALGPLSISNLGKMPLKRCL